MKKIFIDVYAWVTACETHGTVVMEGIFRHGERLCKKYRPAVYVLPNEPLSVKGAMLLQRFIGKEIEVFSSVADLVKAECACWVSLAVDFPSPLLEEKTPFPKLSILHDTMAADGAFSSKRALFNRGAKGNDVFAYVSVTALAAFTSSRFMGTVNPRAKFIKYGNFHTHDKLPELSDEIARKHLLAVHTLFKRKNIEQEIAFAQTNRIPFVHIGGNRGDYTPEWIAEQNCKPSVCLAGFVPDGVLAGAYKTAKAFICMSDDEGFSIPALEAILYGVPHIILSPITAHKEIYSRYSVTFLEKKAVGSVPFLYTITEADRLDAFKRYGADYVSSALDTYLDSLKV